MNIASSWNNDIYERIAKINQSLISVFDKIYESWNGKIMEFSFWHYSENSNDIVFKDSYHRFESMLTQVSNIIKNFENISNFEKSIDHRQSVSPKSGMIEKNTLKQNEVNLNFVSNKI